MDAQLEPPGDVQSVIADESQPRGAQADTGRGALDTGENESVVTLADAELANIDNGESGEMEEVSTQSLQADIGGEAAGVREALRRMRWPLKVFRPTQAGRLRVG